MKTELIQNLHTTDESNLRLNANSLNQEFDWFRQVLESRIALYFNNKCDYQTIDEIEAPDLEFDQSDYASLVKQYEMTMAERLLLILTLIPHLRPQLLNLFFIQDQTINKSFVEFGGWQGTRHQGFLPTGETAAFLLAGDDLHQRLQMLRLLEPDHFFTRDGILDVQHATSKESCLTSPLVISNEYFHRLTSGHHYKPDYSLHFPAQLTTTDLSWDDLVLPARVIGEIEHIHTWLSNKQYIMQKMGLDKSIKPGYRALFYGPPGTGKTLTACLLGQSCNMDVYRIDLSAVVSKYIGETEKNLETIFSQAENKQWVLFFDEADALFGKRTQTNSSNDRYANQEISYLLQRVENYPGIVILATNLKANIDEAFSRRFQSITYFPMPDRQHRLLLWQKALNDSHCLDADIDLNVIAKDYELAGGAIINIVRFAAINSLKTGRDKIQQNDLIKGITKELRKEGRMI